jgi:Putative hemolysin
MTKSSSRSGSDYISGSPSLGKAGSLEVRLAQNPEEIKAAQILRYEVFYEECGAEPNEMIGRLKQDVSPIDDFCDVLLVVDHACNKVVGTYRFMLREAALLHGEYFTASEFDISKLLAFPGQIMELGRSCVHKDYRNRSTIQLLWRGIAAYMSLNKVGLCFGCGSFIGTDVSKYAQALSYLYHNHLAPPDIRAKALPQHYQKMDLIPASQINSKEAMKQLPPPY